MTEHVRGAFLTDPDRGLQEYLFGGPTGLREKTQMAQLLQSLRPEGARERDHLPAYYSSLRELVIRLLRRPAQMQAALRQAEAASALCAARQRITVEAAFGEEFDPLASKLVADVCGFLVGAAELDGEFRVQSRAFFLGEPVQSTTRRSKPTRTSAASFPAKSHLSPSGEALSRDSSRAVDGAGTEANPEASYEANSDAGLDARLDASPEPVSDSTDDDRTDGTKGSDGADGATRARSATGDEQQPSLDL